MVTIVTFVYITITLMGGWTAVIVQRPKAQLSIPPSVCPPEPHPAAANVIVVGKASLYALPTPLDNL